MKVRSKSAVALFYLRLLVQIIWRFELHIYNFAATRYSTSVTSDTIRIIDRNPKTRQSFTALIEEALELIAEADMPCYLRIAREIKTIIHQISETGACYPGPFKVCWIEQGPFQEAKALDGTVAILACILVHESVHGHLYRKHIIQTRSNYSRVEDVCNRAMFRFARRIGYDAERWVTQASRKQTSFRERWQTIRRKLAERDGVNDSK